MITTRTTAIRRDALDTMGERNRGMVAAWSPEAVGAQMTEIIRQAIAARRKENG